MTAVLTGGLLLLTVTVFDALDNVLVGRTVAWSSSDTGTATVDSNGVVSAVAAGPCTITATCEGKSSALAITCLARVDHIDLTPADPTILIGATQQFTAVLKDALNNVLTGRVVTWASSDPTVATVDSTGLATGVGVGSCTITAACEGKTATAALAARVFVTADVAIAQLNAAGADVLATFVASGLADGSDINTLWSNHWRKAGLTDADISQLQLIGGTGAAGQCIKTYNSDGVAVVRYNVGWVRSTATWNALDQTLGFSIYVIGTFKSPQGCLMAAQNAIDFATPTRRVALVSDLFTYNAQHPSIDYLSPSDRYQMRCGLDANMRSYGMSIAPPRSGETNPRYNLQRSADVAVEDHKDFIQGPANHAQNAADVAAIAGANSLILGTSSGVWGGASNDDIAAIIICRAPQVAAHSFIVEQFAQDSCKAFKETAPRVVSIGDSVNWQTFLPDALSGGNADYSTASPDFINADLAAALPAGWHGTNGAWGGETAQSALNDRWSFLYPILLNARSRSRVVAAFQPGVNDFTGPPGVGPSGYSDPGGAPSIYANRQAIIAKIRALTNADRIKVDEWTIQPAWVNGATTPTAPQEVTRRALNALILAGPRTSDHLTDITTDPTIGQPGENANATYYDNSDGWMVHMTPAGRAIRRTYVAAAVAAEA